MRKLGLSIVVLLVALSFAMPTQAVTQGATKTYSVLYANGITAAQGRAAVEAIGGTVVRENLRVGLAEVRTTNPRFLADVAAQPLLFGAVPATTALDRVDGKREQAIEREGASDAAAAQEPERATREPFFEFQWNMRMIDAGPDGSWSVQQGDPGVLVGIIDTGIDGSHPDIAPNFDAALSRNFTRDRPELDGPCEEDPDRSCRDPANVDENGHGTHVAGIVAAALNNLGVGGVAPDVTLVNLRAGQDSGYFFLQATVDALTYAGDNGIDVVNMSYFIDPWLFNCPNNPADSPQEQRQQRTTIEATNRALNYAHDRGVTLVAAAGNSAFDMDNKDEIIDEGSPDPGNPRPRQIDESCLDLPAEGDHVIVVSSVGPSGRKAYYSNYGSFVDVSAPGGDRREFFGTPRYNQPQNRILSTYPGSVAREERAVGGSCESKHPLYLTDRRDGVCAVYAWLQGTSMASPHAAGVAALIVSEYGVADPAHGGLRMNPDRVEEILERTAEDHACPPGGVIDYPDLPEEFTAECRGTAENNTFYGHGIVNALNAVTRG